MFHPRILGNASERLSGDLMSMRLQLYAPSLPFKALMMPHRPFVVNLMHLIDLLHALDSTLLPACMGQQRTKGQPRLGTQKSDRADQNLSLSLALFLATTPIPRP